MPTPRAASRPCPPRPRAAGALLGALLLGTGLPLALAAPAAAHDRLVSTDPADGAPLEVAPDAVTLTMSSTPLALGTQVQVSGPAGVVSAGEPRIVDEAVTQALTGERPAGTYEVQWRVTSSDGHPISGSFTFTTARAAVAPLPATATGTPSPTSPAASPAPSAPSATGTTDDTGEDQGEGGGTGGGAGGGALLGIAAALVVVGGGVGGVIGYRRRRG